MKQRTFPRALVLPLFLALASACSDDSDPGGGDGDGDASGDGDAGDGDGDTSGDGDGDVSFAAPSGQACDAAARLGSFNVYLGDDYTSFAGAISDGVVPNGVPELLEEAGGCRLLGAPNHFCEESCAGGQTCGTEGSCIATPVKISAGTVTVLGLETAVEKAPNGITSDYSLTFNDPYPGMVPGVEITLSAPGDVAPGFVLHGRGVEPLTSAESVILVESGKASELAWDAPTQAVEGALVHVKLTVNAHGATTAWIECTFEDTGAAEIPEPLITGLVAEGLSGFPRATLSRRTVDHASVGDGCVDFRVTSDVTIPAEIPGLVSCSDDEDCPDGQTCQEDLACGD